MILPTKGAVIAWQPTVRAAPVKWQTADSTLCLIVCHPLPDRHSCPTLDLDFHSLTSAGRLVDA